MFLDSSPKKTFSDNHIKLCSKVFLIRDLQNRTIIQHTYIPITIAKIQKLLIAIPVTGKHVE